jgi:hypothetical protein
MQQLCSNVIGSKLFRDVPKKRASRFLFLYLQQMLFRHTQVNLTYSRQEPHITGCCRLFLCVTLPCLVFAFAVSAQTLPSRAVPAGATRAISAADNPQSTMININDLPVWITDNGMLERRPDDLSAGVTYPRGTSTLVHASGILWGGIVNDGHTPALRVGGGSYSQGLQPGRILRPGVAENPANSDVRVYRIRPDWRTADLTQDAADLLHVTTFDVTTNDIERVRGDYRRDWIEWPWQEGAPYVEKNGIPGYQPDTSGSPDADVPGIPSAGQTVWFVANDLDASLVNRLYGSPPVGLELQVTCWAYNSLPSLNSTVFERFRIIYKGTETTPANAVIDSMYFSKWSDPDVGDYSDDLVGCDPSRNLAYAYNYSASDIEYQKYNMVPPVVGYRLLEGPRIPQSGSTASWDLRHIPGETNQPMTSFTYFESYYRTSDYDFSYTGTREWWNLFRGYLAKPLSPLQCFTKPGTNECTSYELTGDPVTFHGWIDGTAYLPGDRRMSMSTGPFSLAFGDSQEVVVALIAARGSDNRSGINDLKAISDKANDAFRMDFQFPDTVPSPNLRVVELDGKLILEWESDTARQRTVESYDSRGYRFESYVVYQLPRADATKEEGVVYENFDPVQPRYVTITRDALRNRPMVNGQEYYFAVTTSAYNSDPELTDHWRESPLIVHSCIPHTPNPGTVYPYAIGEHIQEGSNIVGSNDAVPLLSYFDPTKPDGHLYTITFHRETDPFREFLTKPDWTLVDSTTGDTLAHSKADQPAVRVIPRGFTLQLLSPRFGIRGVYQTEANGQTMNAPVFNQLNPGGNFMVIANGYSDLDTLRGQATTDIDIELRFNGDSSWGLNRASTAPKSHWIHLPFTVWQVGKIGRDSIFKQTYAIMDGTSGDSIWRAERLFPDPTNNDRMVKGFYPLSVMGDSMAATADDGISTIYFFGTYDDSISMRPNSTQMRTYLWLASQNLRPTMSFRKAIILDCDSDGVAAPAGTVIRFRDYKAIRSGDQKLIVPHKLLTNDLAAAKSAINDINVFPNPYYGINRAETSRFDHYVTFSHLPRKVTVRVFNLAGVLVRTLTKDDPAQFLRWDLKNESGLTAAAGLYLVHLQLGQDQWEDLGEKILKLMIVPPDPTPQKN